MALKQALATPGASTRERVTNPSKRALWSRIWEARNAYLMILPTLALLVVFEYYPAFLGLYRSLFDWSAGLPAEYVGFGNFVTLFTADPVFIESFRNVAILTVWNVASTVVISVAVAVLIHAIRSQRGQYVFRLFMVLPTTIPSIVPILLWVFIYDYTIGPLNALLLAIGLGDLRQAWLGNPDTALYAVMLRNFPWIDGISVLIILAGLQTIPLEVIESSRVDGAGALRQLWSIQIPLITRQVKLIAILTILGSVQGFSSIFAMTQGGPINSTQVPGMWMYFNAFSLGKMGYASAIGVVMFVVTLILTVANMRFIRTHDV